MAGQQKKHTTSANRRPPARAMAASGQAGPPADPRETRWAKEWLLAAALVAAVFVAYQPAWRGGFLWDNDAHVTRAELRSWQGLYHIWFKPGATEQYYPLLHSAVSGLSTISGATRRWAITF